jgi:hypothetical protein
MTAIEKLKRIKDKIIRKQAIHNIIIQNNMKCNSISRNYVNMYKYCDNMNDAINEFICRDTIQGHDYWQYIVISSLKK